MLAPVSFVVTDPPQPAPTIDVVVVFPLVPLTRMTERPRASDVPRGQFAAVLIRGARPPPPRHDHRRGRRLSVGAADEDDGASPGERRDQVRCDFHADSATDDGAGTPPGHALDPVYGSNGHGGDTVSHNR